jgi:uronate dehydrogenase
VFGDCSQVSVVPHTVLLTGAGGNIGSELRARWEGRFPLLRLTDLRELSVARAGEEVSTCDLSIWEDTFDLVRGADVIVHLAAIPDEDSFLRLLDANITATYNIFEAARLHGTKRVVFASTNHVTGYYPCDEQIPPTASPRPDTLYGATKAFGELLGRLYHDKFGLEVVCIRIGSFRPEPTNFRYLSTWLSPRDASEILFRAVTAAGVGFLTVYGVSRTSRPYWSNDAAAAALGYSPEDDADAYAAGVIKEGAATEGGNCRQGGDYAMPAYHGGDAQQSR